MTRRDLVERVTLAEVYEWLSYDELEAHDRQRARDKAEAKARLRR